MMSPFTRLVAIHRALAVTPWNVGNGIRFFRWTATGKEVTDEEVVKLITSREFMGKMSRILPGSEKIRVTSAGLEADFENKYPNTMYEALKYASERNTANRNICGWVNQRTNAIEFLTYDQFFDEAKQISMALRELGIQPKDFVAVNFVNSKDYLEMMYGVTSMSMILQPIYPNLDASAIRKILKQSQSKIYVVDTEAKARVVVERAHQMPVKILVVAGYEPSKDLRNDARSVSVQLLSLSDFMKLGENKRYLFALPKSADTFSLFYTSGTTGDPKGAIVTHGRLLQMYHTVSRLLKVSPRYPGDYTFCFLPTGHIYETLFGLLCLADGGTAMFWSGSIKHLISDLRRIKPHHIPMVPRIMNRIYDEVYSELTKNFFKRIVFMYCYQRKKRLISSNKYSPICHDTIYDRLAFRRVREILGGRISTIVSASAPLNPKVLEFFKVTVGCAVIEVFGSTEAMVVTATSPYDSTGGHTGGPVPSVKIKLVDVPELDYYAKDDVGEIYVKSPFGFEGYYNDEAATKETIRNGWIATGDVGKWNAEGKLQIFDRRNDIFKLAQGEYIIPEKIESIYGRVQIFEDVFIDGRSDQNFCVAVAVPNQALFMKWAKAKNFTHEFEPVFMELCHDIQVRKACLEELRRAGMAQGLNELQQIQNIYLEAIPFSVASGILTSTYKVKRNFARKKYAQTIDELYREGSLINGKP
ncbi:long-chain-fatty-acid--CoA ligase 1-like [Varroa destructor]|uniref:long-chain-fatty-acid--CoA ligase n=1 Tax=Varroa destructor TaxID=109461 RepID=A0A7M7JHE8_VARDE|nr:long-chain-fatty-acid--CoA ligase 1-like [Varroa destructor]